jgi:signal transduction histidine kinase
LANAGKFTENGAIRLEARRQHANGVDWFVVAVSDTGASIAAEAMERLFDPFAEADTTLTSRSGSAGLGLVITRRVARLLGGDVTVESAPSTGSTLILRTPVIARVNTPAHLGDDEALAVLPAQARAHG